MPSIGRIQKLSVLGIATAALGATASSASAGDVWLWACQGPTGQPLGGSLFDGTGFITDGCAEPGGVLRAELTAQDQGERTLRAIVPPGTKLANVSLQHNAGSGASYAVTAPTSDKPLGPLANGEQTLPVNATTESGELKLSLKCASSACENASLAVGKIGLNVVDDSKPTLAVGGFRSPGSDFRPPTGPYDLPMTFDVRASDTGSGLRRADILVDGVVVGPGKEFDGDDCQGEDLSAGSPQVDLALGSQCVTYGDVKIPVKTLDFANGQHTLEVRVTDWAGNVGVWAPAEPWSILNNPDLGSDTATLNIGSSGVDVPQPNPSSGPGGGVGGAQSTSCRTPRLSVSLRSKPLRMSKNRPVLLAKKGYRFEGRLTCVVNGKRRSAPKSTRIEVLNTVGRKTVSKPATRLRASGKLNAILKTPNVSGTRTLIFRYRNTSGQRAQVSIRVTITKRAPKR